MSVSASVGIDKTLLYS